MTAASSSVATPPTPDNTTFEQPETAPVQAYVVSTEVQDSNEANQKVEDLATL